LSQACQQDRRDNVTVARKAGSTSEEYWKLVRLSLGVME
jgi:hypothetical protein